MTEEERQKIIAVIRYALDLADEHGPDCEPCGGCAYEYHRDIIEKAIERKLGWRLKKETE